MKKNLVSIVVPVYNVEKYINKCVNSLLNQTYKNIEIILVNDGSTDNSLAICLELAKKDKRIKVINKKNGGLSDARNKGIKSANGDYITFVDSDDWIDSDTIEIGINALLEDNSDLVIYGISNDYQDGSTKKYPPEKREKLEKKKALIYLNSYKGVNVSACNKIYRKSLFDNIAFPYGKKCEDYYIMYKIFDKCNTISILPIVKYHYYQRTNSITHSSNVNMDFLYAAEEQVDYFKINHNDILYAAITGYVFANIVIYNSKFVREIEFDRRKIQHDMKLYRKYINENKDLSKIRKIQYFVFSSLPSIYDFYLKIKTKK